MASQIRPTRLDVTDRFPMLGFTILTDGPPRLAEVVIATGIDLFTKPEGRTSANFYSSREHGLLSLPKRDAVYVVPPDVLARFIAADRLWFGLATASPPAASDWTVDVLPSEASPYVSLSGLSDRALRRVRMFPTRGASGGYGGGSRAGVLDWAGDRVRAGAAPAPAAQPAPANGAPAPAASDVPYDDGFGPLPPLTAAETPPASPVAPPEADADAIGIDGPVLDDSVPPQAMALGSRPRALTAAEYPGVTRIMPSPAYSGRGGQAIDRIVIHITGAPQSPHIGSWFAREEANSSAHYMVDQNGEIIQFVREQDKAWHAGSANRRSIGIEHVAIQQGGARYGSTTYPYTPPTDAEYRASAALVAHLCRKYGLTPDRTTIIGHREADTSTTHTACPDGAWDWDGYMALVAQCYAALPATGLGRGLARGLEIDPETMGIEGPAHSEAAPVQAAALALTAKDYDRASRTAPSPAFTAGRSQAIDRIVIHITDAPTTSSTVNHFTRADANSSAHYLVGQDGEIVQFVSEADTAWHARGVNGRSIGIEHVAVKQGGATYGSTTFPHMPPTDTQYCESAALVSHLCQKYGLTPDRTTIIGHREADANTTHTSCPDGAWNWDHFMELVTNQYCAPQPALAQSRAYARAESWSGPRAMSGGGETVEIKYRVFIPSPLIKGPNSDYDFGPIASGEDFSGDGRGFSYDGGTSRGEITATLTLGADGGISDLRTVDRHWGESKAYDSTYTYHVAGKPDWWVDKHAGHTPSRHATLAADDDNLKIYRGASGTTRNILAMTSQSAVVSIYLSGSLPLVSPSPAIDADIAIYLKRGANGIEAMVVGDHDGFPCHELYINGQLIFGYDPVAAGNGPTSLLPPTDREVSTGWIAVPSRAPAVAQGLGVARGLTARTLVFKDRPASEPWHMVDYDRVTLTEVSWSDAPDTPVAFVCMGHVSIDFDGSPTAYHPDDTGDDHLANAGDATSGWYGVVAMKPTDPLVANGTVLIDQRPERLFKGEYPVIQQEKNGDPRPGYYVSQTSRAADRSLANHLQRRYLDASSVAYGALSGKLKGLGVGLGDFGLAVRNDRNLQSGFWMADSGGRNSYALGECAQKVGTNLGGSGRGNRFNNNFPVSILVFPGTSTTSRDDPPPSEADIASRVTAIMTELCLADNARELALLMAFNEVRPGQRPPGKAGLDAYLADPANTPLPRNYATIVEGLRNFNFNVREPAAAQGLSRRAPAHALDTMDWSINWDDVEQIPQPSDMGCWATAAAMLKGWRDRQSVSPQLLASCNGFESSLSGGLSPGDKQAFADSVGLIVHPNACYTAEGFRDVLEANGPVWVTAKVPFVHAIVVTGMYSAGGVTYVRITDPLDREVGAPGAPGARPMTHVTGSRYIMTYDNFAAEFEAAGDIDRIQLLHTGGTHGHTANRGNARAMGPAANYALALSDAGATETATLAPSTPPTPAQAPAGDASLGVGTSLTRQASGKNGRRYDLAQLAGMVLPANALAGGAGAPALPGERVVLDDWPYIEGPSGRTQAGVAIDWKYQGGAVGDVAIAPIEGQVLDGWSAAVKADISLNGSMPERTHLKVRVTTVFSRQDEEDQVAVTDVILMGDGRQQTRHGADRAPAEPLPPEPAAPDAPPQLLRA
ncbi:N-acetylmuramoyl-L-alanine amidase [Sphingomonas gilva]|nr:N-acetylmuramoyl-L-alanine amidase [Sphingomonas gilva]